MLNIINPRSITSRILVILIVAFLLIIMMSYWVIQTQAKPQIIAMTSQAVEETGNEIINGIIANINEIDGMARASTAIIGTLPKDEALYQQSFGNLMDKADARVVSGGIWFDPNMYEWHLDRQSFVWERDSFGEMRYTDRYNSLEQTPNDYFKDWWYTPAYYAKHDQCVWSRAYVKADTKTPQITCAKAIYDQTNGAYQGVVSFDIALDNINTLINTWQSKISDEDGTGGYVFLLDLDNRFLSFPDESLITQVTEDNPQGEVITASKLAEKYPSFKSIAQSVDKLNTQLLNDAIAEDEGRYEWVAGAIHRKTNMNKISRDESTLLSALLLLNEYKPTDLADSHLVDTVAITDDFLLQQDATAFVFTLPFTHWKMVMVKPNNAMTTLANQLSEQLALFMLLGFIPILLLMAISIRKFFTRPLSRMAASLEDMGTLISQNKYHVLNEYKLPHSNITEIGIIGDKTNQLITRIVENEGALADINVHLENKVAERTSELKSAMDKLKASQVHLVRSEKMASLGQMVAGVAHEVNTPLGYVRSNMEMVGDTIYRFDEVIEYTQKLIDTLNDPTATQEQIDKAIKDTATCCNEILEDEVTDDLNNIVKDGLYGVDQISELVINLRDFSRIDESKVKSVDINDCIDSSLIMAKNNLKSLTVHKHLADLPPLKCNPSQINQVLLNLFNNAAQAIPIDRQGVLTVNSFTRDDNIVIEVSDNGSGISDDVKSSIFEPFFTTKKAGEGTGLGLAITQQIIEKHEGTLTVDSVINEGTTFTITLPLHASHNTTQSKSNPLFTD